MQPPRSTVAVVDATAAGNSGGAEGSGRANRKPPQEPACLVLMHRPSRLGIGRRHPVFAHGFRLGNSADDFALSADAGLAAEIAMHGDGVWQLTSFSPTAVFVNDSPLAGSIQLEDEDELEILDNYFVFRERDTEDSTYYELIYQLTIQDVPSRLANERIVREALTREAAHASRYRSSLAVASIGLYCEDCRPTALDHYLRDFGEVLRQALGRAVTVGRIDSRELAIVAPNFDAGTLHDNISAAHSIVQTNALTFPPCRIQIEVSAYHEGLTAADLLRKAARSAE